MKRIFLGLAGLLLLAANNQAAPPAPAATSVEPAVAFGARENVEFVALSPDGERVAYAVASEGQGSRLYVLEIGSTAPRAITNVNGDRQRLTHCNWVSNRRLLCNLFNIARSAGFLTSASRMVALDIGNHPFPESKGFGVRVVYSENINALLHPIVDNTLQFLPEVFPVVAFKIYR